MKLKKQQRQQQQEFHITRSYRPALLAPVFCCHSNHDHPHGPVRKLKKLRFRYTVIYVTSTGSLEAVLRDNRSLVVRAPNQRNLPQTV